MLLLRNTLGINANTIQLKADQQSFNTDKSHNSDSQNTSSLIEVIPDSIQRDSSASVIHANAQRLMPEPVELFNLNHADKSKFDYKPLKVFIEKNNSDKLVYKDLLYRIRSDYRSDLNWTLIIGLICVSLFLALRNNYQKFVNQVINALVNFQLAQKILQEKNILARRAYYMLNINYVLVFALFILMMLISVDYRRTSNYFLDYLLIILGLLGILFIKLAIIYINGYIFQMMQATSEYVHNIYLINKNLGIILLPLIFGIIFTPPIVSKSLLIVVFSLVSIGTIFKIIRGFQIIIKNKVLLFYSILYLCTLELLPLALGSKLLIALR
jgi:hypothetical protein